MGSVNMDLIVEAERPARPGETLLGGRFSMAGGGKGANQAVAAARLGASVAMVGAVGGDRFGEFMLSALEEEGVDCRHVATRNGEATGVAMITVFPGGENSIIVAPGANATVTGGDLLEGGSLFEGADALLVQLELPPETAVEALRLGKTSRALTVFDPAPYAALPDEAWGFVDIAVPNRLELAGFTGTGDLEEGAGRLLEKGAGAVVVTLGPEGAMIRRGREVKRVGAFPVEAVDATGAGDAFSAALAVSLAEGKPLYEAALFASAAGALACTVVGAQPGLPAREQVEGLLRGPSGGPPGKFQGEV